MQQALTRLARPVVSRASFSIRTFTTFCPLRPCLDQSATTSPFRRRTAAAVVQLPPSQPDVVVVPSSISSHPALAGVAGQQIRCGPRNTMHGATRLVQKRRLGYLVRKRSRTGRAILRRRREKGRCRLGCSR